MPLVVLFLGFWLFTDPNGAADNAQSAASWLWDGTKQGFQAVIDFLDAL